MLILKGAALGPRLEMPTTPHFFNNLVYSRKGISSCFNVTSEESRTLILIKIFYFCVLAYFDLLNLILQIVQYLRNRFWNKTESILVPPITDCETLKNVLGRCLCLSVPTYKMSLLVVDTP